jgi:predicted nucleic acid-binding protein
MIETLLDTGPLLAYLDADDRFHDWVCEQWRALSPPLIICEPVLTEAVFLIKNQGVDLDSLWELMRRKILEVDFDIQEDFEHVSVLMRRYANLPMDLADACLVRMAEKRKDIRVFTLDSDFKIYRRHGRQIIPLIFPE